MPKNHIFTKKILLFYLTSACYTKTFEEGSENSELAPRYIHRKCAYINQIFWTRPSFKVMWDIQKVSKSHFKNFLGLLTSISNFRKKIRCIQQILFSEKFALYLLSEYAFWHIHIAFVCTLDYHVEETVL